MRLFSQRDPRWAKHVLGWGPALGTIGAYGCLLTDYAMIAGDAFPANPYTPDKLDELLTARKLFARDATGTMDLLSDNSLDLLWPDRFKSLSYAGFRPDVIGTGVRSADTYVILWISTRTVPTHFVIAYNALGTAIADPWTGKVGLLSGYGGPQAVHKTLTVRKLRPAPVVVNPTPPVPAPVPVGPAIPVPSPVPPSVISHASGGFMDNALKIAKAIAAALLAGVAVLGAAQAKGSVGQADLIAAAVAALVAGVGVWAVPNKAAS